MRNITSSFVIVMNLSMVAAAARQLGPASPTTLVSFNGADGASPFGGLIADADGNLFGTTEDGGAHNRGTVFELAKTATGYASAPEVLVNFGSYAADGQAPLAGVMADANGNLFGTAANGGQSDGGTVFEILNNGGVYATTSTIPRELQRLELHQPEHAGVDSTIREPESRRHRAWVFHRGGATAGCQRVLRTVALIEREQHVAVGGIGQ